MAPGEIAQGLSLRSPELVALEREGQYAYRMVVQQETLKHSLLKGYLRVEVEGQLDGEPVTDPSCEVRPPAGPVLVQVGKKRFARVLPAS